MRCNFYLVIHGVCLLNGKGWVAIIIIEKIKRFEKRKKKEVVLL